MSLTSPRVIGVFIALSLGAFLIASCSEQPTPVSPSAVSVSPDLAAPVTEYWVTLFDEAEPAIDEEPAPAPPPPPPPPPPGSAWTPWPPGPSPIAQPDVPVPTPPSTHWRMNIKVDPEPVAHSGVRVPLFACRDHPYTWYYDQILDSETGTPVNLTERWNFLDGRFVNKSTETITLGGNGTPNKAVTIHTRWCSSFAKPHYAQTRYKGRDGTGDGVEISGPWVRLLTP
jgi:hypothetical protein